MPGQAADAGDAGDADQCARAALLPSARRRDGRSPPCRGCWSRRCARITSRSARTAVSMPTLMPALAITTSGTPCCADAGVAGGRRCCRCRARRRRRPHSARRRALAPRAQRSTSSLRRADQRQPPAGLVIAPGQRLADAARGAGDEDQLCAVGGPCASARCVRRSTPRTWPLQLHHRLQVVVVHAVGAEAVAAARHLHRQVRPHALGVDEACRNSPRNSSLGCRVPGRRCWPRA